MLNSFQRLSVLAAVFLVATVAGASAANFDKPTEVAITVKNKFSISLFITINGTDATIDAGAEKKGVTKATTHKSIHWKAKPSKESDKGQFLSCEGDATVSDMGVVTVEKDPSKCVQAPASKSVTVSPKDVEKLIVSVDQTISVENKSKYEAELWIWDQHVGTTTTHKIPVNGTWSFRANVKNGALDLNVSPHCAFSGNPTVFVDVEHYSKLLNSIQIYDEQPKNDDDKKNPNRLICRLTPKGA